MSRVQKTGGVDAAFGLVGVLGIRVESGSVESRAVGSPAYKGFPALDGLRINLYQNSHFISMVQLMAVGTIRGDV